MSEKRGVSVVQPHEPNEVIAKEGEVVCIWKECPNVFGGRSEWRVRVKEDGRSFARGKGGSEHYPLTIVAIKIAKEKGVLKYEPLSFMNIPEEYLEEAEG